LVVWCFYTQTPKKDNLGDGNQRRSRISTYLRAHQLLTIFNHRLGTRNEESKFEFLALGLYGSEPPSYRLFEAGSPEKDISLDEFLSKLLQIVAERNPEDFIYQSGRLWKPRQLGFGETEEESAEWPSDFCGGHSAKKPCPSQNLRHLETNPPLCDADPSEEQNLFLTAVTGPAGF
jgi:hypothetical protein